MSKLSSPAEYEDDIVEGSQPSRLFSFLPYLLILALTLVGVGYTSISKSSLGVYWEVLAVITGILCIISGWPHAHNRDSRTRLVWTQVLHWAAFLAIMVLLLHTDVSQMLNTDFDRACDPSASCAWNLCCWRSYAVLANLRARRGGGACRPCHRLDRGIRAPPRSRLVRVHCACRYFLVVRAASRFGWGSRLGQRKSQGESGVSSCPEPVLS